MKVSTIVFLAGIGIFAIIAAFVVENLRMDIHELEASYDRMDTKLDVIECYLGIDTEPEQAYVPKPKPKTLTEAQRQVEDHQRWAERQMRRLHKMEICLALLQARSGETHE